MNTRRLPWIGIACLALAACSGPAVKSATATPGVSGVACQGNAGDASKIQAVIDASAQGTVIQIGGGTCLLTRGIVLAGGLRPRRAQDPRRQRNPPSRHLMLMYWNALVSLQSP